MTQAEVDADQTITFFARIHGPVAEEAARQNDLTFVRIAQLVTFLVCKQPKGQKITNSGAAFRTALPSSPHPLRRSVNGFDQPIKSQRKLTLVDAKKTIK